jgi:hypothetical protein
MQYKVVREFESEDLEAKVQDYLNKGWQLQGGVSCSISETEEECFPEYCQALTKED